MTCWSDPRGVPPEVRPLHRPLKLRIRKGHPTGDGTGLESGRDHPSGGARSLAGSTPAPSAPARAGGFDDSFDGVRGPPAGVGGDVAKRDHHTCQHCGVQPGAEAIMSDHVVPRSQGGVSNWTNCVASCVRCNALKADRTAGAGRHGASAPSGRPRVEAALRGTWRPGRELAPVPGA